MDPIIWILIGIVLLVLFIIKFKKIALFIFIVGGLVFVAYELGLFGWAIKQIFGYG